MAAQLSMGIVVEFSTLAGEIMDVNQSGEKADTQDSTGQSKTWREFLCGFLDGGEWTIDVQFASSQAQPATGTTGDLTVTLPPIAGGRKYKCAAILTGKSLKAALGQLMIMSFSFKMSGQPNWYY
jgi:hypothetical protein